MRRTQVPSPHVPADAHAAAVHRRVQRPRSVTQMRSEFATLVIAGLREHPKRLPSVYFYDDRGSALFEEITKLPEYYLTQVEREVLSAHAEAIDALLGGAACCVVDLGAGSGDKAQVVLARMREQRRDVRYAPVDVSAAALWSAEQHMHARVPGLRVDPIHDDYIHGLARVRALSDRRLLVLWLGSSIGNFDDAAAVATLRGLAEVCTAADVLLIGFDLLKDPEVLVAAYADGRGVTAEFNYNLLRRINRELGADFDVEQFVHHATFSPALGRMESYLISRVRQTVTLAGQRFELDAWEPIHTEVSYKYSERRIDALLEAAGLTRIALFTDPERRFADVACRRAPGRERS